MQRTRSHRSDLRRCRCNLEVRCISPVALHVHLRITFYSGERHELRKSGCAWCCGSCKKRFRRMSPGQDEEGIDALSVLLSHHRYLRKIWLGLGGCFGVVLLILLLLLLLLLRDALQYYSIIISLLSNSEAMLAGRCTETETATRSPLAWGPTHIICSGCARRPGHWHEDHFRAKKTA